MRYFWIITGLLFGLLSLNGQQTLLTIGDREISLEEFERIYNKNNSSLNVARQTPEEYMELFINFKLKVLEAEALGMDTTQKFINEFNKYKDQLAKPYMTDDDTKEQLIKEAYERMQKDIKVSHILLRLSPSASPEDTLRYYEKAIAIRDRILAGEDFEKVARATSEDPSVKQNGGNLGFFTVFMMVYPFETAAYDLGVGEVSMPVRTVHGYHILKKHDERNAIGQVKVAHIFLATPQGMPEEEKSAVIKKAASLSDSLMAGIDFADIAARYSDDRRSAANGGELPWFGTGRMIPEFEAAAFKLKNTGDICEPFQTQYGMHIIKLLDRKPIGTLEEMRGQLESKALKGDRDRIKRDRYQKKLQEKYQFGVDETLYSKFLGIVDSTIFDAAWTIPANNLPMDASLFSIKNDAISLGEFAAYVQKEQQKRSQNTIAGYVEILRKKRVEEWLLEVEKNSLTERFPEYRYILQEYHDGILLFELMDQKVWSFAVKDSAGLENFFNERRDQYMWGDRYEAIRVYADSGTNLSPVREKIDKVTSGRWSASKLNRKFAKDTVPHIFLEELLEEKGVNEELDNAIAKDGLGDILQTASGTEFYVVSKKRKPAPKELEDTRGKVTSDYQDYLEQQWLKTLRSKYEITVNEELLSKIKSTSEL